MSDVGTGVFAKRSVVPEDVVASSVFPYQRRTQIPRPSRQALSQKS